MLLATGFDLYSSARRPVGPSVSTSQRAAINPPRASLNGWVTLVLFLPPALVLFTVFVAMPMGEAGWYSFYNWNGYGRPEKFVGLKNYGYLLDSAPFRARADQQWPHHPGIAGRAAAARARRGADGRGPVSPAPSGSG